MCARAVGSSGNGPVSPAQIQPEGCNSLLQGSNSARHRVLQVTPSARADAGHVLKMDQCLISVCGKACTVPGLPSIKMNCKSGRAKKISGGMVPFSCVPASINVCIGDSWRSYYLLCNTIWLQIPSLLPPLWLQASGSSPVRESQATDWRP